MMMAGSVQRKADVIGVLKAENYRTNEWRKIVAGWHPIYRNIAAIILQTPKDKRADVKNALSIVSSGEDEINESVAQFALDLANLSDRSLKRISKALVDQDVEGN